MGVKRFLVAGGMASLVLIGAVLIFDAQALAKNPNNQSGDVNVPGVGNVQVPDQVPDDWDSPQEVQENVSQLQVPTPPDGPPPSGPDGPPPSGPDGPPPGGGGDTGMELALGGGGPPPSGPDGPPPGGGGDTGGAVGSDGDPTPTLPDTGGPSVVLLPIAGPLLLAIAMLLGSGLLVAAFVRLVRS
jgi:hypothetical protein